MHSYVLSLKKLFEANANPANAAPMKKYMRDQFEYLGIKSPQFKVLFSEFIKKNGLPPREDLDVISRELWGLPEREFQYLAVGLIEKMGKLWDDLDKDGKDYFVQKGGKITILSKEENERWAAKLSPILDEYVQTMKAKNLPAGEALKFCQDYLKSHQK